MKPILTRIKLNCFLITTLLTLTLSISQSCLALGIEITHIKQPYAPNVYYFDFNSTLRESYVRVQHQIAIQILQEPTIHVVSEDLYDDMILNSNDFHIPMYKTIFPDGFPGDFKDLNDFQKQALYKDGGALVLFYLGLLPAIHKFIDRDVEYKINEKARLVDFLGSLGAIEDAVITNITTTIKLNSNKITKVKVIVLSRRERDFYEACQRYNIQLTTINLLEWKKIKPLYDGSKK